MDGHRGGWLARVVLKEICRCVHPYWTSTLVKMPNHNEMNLFFSSVGVELPKWVVGTTFIWITPCQPCFYLCKNFGRFLLSLLRWGEFITPIRAAKVMAIYLDFVKCKTHFLSWLLQTSMLKYWYSTRTQCNLIHSNAYCVMGKWVFY